MAWEDVDLIILNFHAGASAFFVVSPLSKTINLECAFPEGTTNVEWLNASSPDPLLEQPQQRNTTALLSVSIDESNHGGKYVCRGMDSRGQQVYKHYHVIARGEYCLRLEYIGLRLPGMLIMTKAKQFYGFSQNNYGVSMKNMQL